MSWSSSTGWNNLGWEYITASAPSEGTVLFDAGSPSTCAITSTTTSGVVNPSINVGSGTNGTSNLYLVIGLILVGTAAGVSTSPSLVWDPGATNQSMSLITGPIGNGNAGDIYIFGLANPTQGSKNISFSWTSTNEAGLVGASFVNVDQTGGTTTFKDIVTNTGSGSPAIATVSTTPTTRKFFTAYSTGGNFTSPSPGTDLGHNNSGNTGSAAGSWDVGTATSETYAFSSGTWASLSVALKGA